MFTLKVVTLDHNDEESTTLFSGDSITHAERILKGTELKNYPSSRQVGSYINELSEQPFVASQVLITTERVVKEELLILPKSTCFITESGKTVDTFHSFFKQV